MVTAGLTKYPPAQHMHHLMLLATLFRNNGNFIKSIMSDGKVSSWSQGKVFLFNNRLTRWRYRGERGTPQWSVDMARFGVVLHRE